MVSEIIDISQSIRPGIPVWPGDTGFEIHENWTISQNCPVLVSKITMSTHTGTHADAHSHYHKDGIDTASRNLAPYLGRCVVVDATGGKGPVGCDAVLPAVEKYDDFPQRVLIRSLSRFPRDTWPDQFRAICPKLIDKLGEHGCCLIGTDAPSIDPESSKILEAHHAVHRHDMAILEGLILDHVVPGLYELIALPLRIENADASPVRAILRTLGT